METSAFAKRLAGNQQTIRDRAIKKLRKFIAAKSAKAGGFSREELLQLWKGLHYSMWMQDKPLLQEDLSEKLCGLLKSFPDTDSALAFSAAFFTTQAREWSRLDSWRMDKFMMLIRDFLRATLELMQRTGWQGKSLEALSAMIGEVMDAAKEDYPDGLRLHLADIYLEEMEKIGAQELTGEQINVMLKPFVKYIVKSRRDTIANQVISKVFMTIVENADSKDEEEEQEEEEGKLQFDYLGLKKMLFDAGRQKSVLPKIRQKIYKLVKRFSELCGTDSSQETPAPQTPVLGKRKLPDEKENDEEKETPKAKKLKKKKRKLEVTIEVEEEQPPTTTTPPADKSTPQPSASQKTPKTTPRHVAFNLARNSSRELKDFVNNIHQSPFTPSRSPSHGILKESPGGTTTISTTTLASKKQQSHPKKNGTPPKGGRNSPQKQKPKQNRKKLSPKFTSKKGGKIVKKPRHK